jgi:hypothetical protein
MSNLRYFPEQEENVGAGNIKRKIKRRRLTRLYKILIVIGILGAILLGYYLYENTRVFTGYNITSSFEEIRYEESEVFNLAGNILTYSKDGANLKTPDGKPLWNITFDMQYPLVSTSGGCVAFADYTGTVIYLVNEAGKTTEITTDKPIAGISVASAGYVTAILEDVDVSWIYMYDLNSRVIAYFRTTMEKSGYPVSVSVSPSGELVAVSYYYLDTAEKRSTVAFYNFGDVGKNNIDNYVSGYNYKDELVPAVSFLNNDKAFMVSTDRLSVFEGAHKPVSISDMFLQKEARSVYNSDSYIGLVFDDAGGDARYELCLYNTSGNLAATIPFNFDYQGVEIGTDAVIIYGDNNFTVAGLKGDIRYTGIYSDTLRLIYSLNGVKRIVAVTDHSIDNIELK